MSRVTKLFINSYTVGGNEGWSAMEEYLIAFVKEASDVKGTILECGSGLTTILIGIAAKKSGCEYLVFEHNDKWASKVEKYIKSYKIDTVRLCKTTLKDFGDYCWNDVSGCSIPKELSLIICDGPPGETKGGRIGLVEQMRNRIVSGTIILLDDAERSDEKRIAIKWSKKLKSDFQILGSKKPYARLVVEN